jgi:hypothetical protein
VHSVNLLLLIGIAERLLPVKAPWPRWLAAIGLAALGMASAGVVSEIGTVMNDLVVSIGVLGSLLLVLRAWPVLAAAPLSAALRQAAWAGVPIGLAVGGKLVAAPYGVALVAAFAALPGGWHRRAVLALGFAAGAAVPVLLLLGPWCWHLWSLTGNPVYPFFNGLFRSPWAGLAGNRDMRWFPHGLGEWLAWPIVFARDPGRISEVPFRDFHIAAAYLLLPPLLVLRLLLPRRPSLPPGAGYLFLLMAAGYLCWLVLFSYVRYAAPLAMLAPLALALAVLALPLPRPAGWAAVLALAAALAGGIRYLDWGRVAWSDRFIAATVPPLARPDDTIILMASSPTSFVIPSFPPEVPFLRLEAPVGLRLDPGSPWLRRVKERLEARPTADLLVLVLGLDRARLAARLAPYGLAPGPEEGCRPIPSTITPPEQIRLCPVVRQPPTTG